MNANIRLLKYIVGVSSALFLIFSLISLFETIQNEKLYERDICFDSQCLKFFAEKTSGIVMYFQAFGWLITTFVTVFGVMIALMTYNAGVKNNNNSNYTSHLTMVREFASAELTKRSSIYPEKVNFFRWYRVMFPEAQGGDISVSRDYLEIISRIKCVIEEANAHITEENKDYKYKTHQRKMMAVLDEIGISISNGPKNIFIEVESQILDYIDTINLSFCHSSSVIELSRVKRKYI